MRLHAAVLVAGAHDGHTERRGRHGGESGAARPGPAPAPALAPRTKWRPRRGGGRGPSVSPGGAGGRHREEGMAERVCGGVCDL